MTIENSFFIDKNNRLYRGHFHGTKKRYHFGGSLKKRCQGDFKDWVYLP
ncbi:hypothetical protein SAMN05216311_111277 [Chitinophaga sp. CF418]|nr:hypothetical protein SAMN05216311_111277 [Chitinophaga sp. CF418]